MSTPSRYPITALPQQLEVTLPTSSFSPASQEDQIRRAVSTETPGLRWVLTSNRGQVSSIQHLSFLICQMGLLGAQPRQVKGGGGSGQKGRVSSSDPWGESRCQAPSPLPPSRKNQSY